MAVVDAVAGDTPPILVGCFRGGKIAIDAALLYPSRVCALVLIAPSVGGAPRESAGQPCGRGIADHPRAALCHRDGEGPSGARQNVPASPDDTGLQLL